MEEWDSDDSLGDDSLGNDSLGNDSLGNDSLSDYTSDSIGGGIDDKDNMEMQEGGMIWFAYSTINNALSDFSKLPRLKIMQAMLAWSGYKSSSFWKTHKLFSKSIKNVNNVMGKFTKLLKKINEDTKTSKQYNLSTDVLKEYDKQSAKQKILLCLAYAYCRNIGTTEQKITDLMEQILTTYNAIEIAKKKNKSVEQITTKLATNPEQIIATRELANLYRDILIILFPNKKTEVEKQDSIELKIVFLYNELQNIEAINKKMEVISAKQRLSVATEVNSAEKELLEINKQRSEFDGISRLPNEIDITDENKYEFKKTIDNINVQVDNTINQISELMVKNAKAMVPEITLSESDIKLYLKENTTGDKTNDVNCRKVLKTIERDQRLKFIILIKDIIVMLNKYEKQRLDKKLTSDIKEILKHMSLIKNSCISINAKLQHPDMIPLSELIKENRVDAIDADQSKYFTKELLEELFSNGTFSKLSPDAFAALPAELFKYFIVVNYWIGTNKDQISLITDEQFEAITEPQATELFRLIDLKSTSLSPIEKAIINKIILFKISSTAGGGLLYSAIGGAVVAGSPASTLGAKSGIYYLIKQLLKLLKNSTPKAIKIQEFIVKEAAKPENGEAVLDSNFINNVKEEPNSPIANALNIFNELTEDNLQETLLTTDGSKISISLINRLNTSPSLLTITNITADKLRGIKPKVFAIFSKELIAKLVEEQIKAITPEQIELLSSSIDGIAKFNAFGENFKFISTGMASISGLSGTSVVTSTFQQIPPLFLKSLEFNTITFNDEQIKKITKDQFINLDLTRLTILCNNKQLTHIPPEIFANIKKDNLNALLKLDNACINSEQLTAIGKKDEFNKIDLVNFELSKLTNEQVEWICKEQMEKLCLLANKIYGTFIKNIDFKTALIATGNTRESGIDATGAPITAPAAVGGVVSTKQYYDYMKKLASIIVATDANKITNAVHSIYIVAKMINLIPFKEYLTNDALNGIDYFIFSQLGGDFLEKINTTLPINFANDFAKYSRLEDFSTNIIKPKFIENVKKMFDQLITDADYADSIYRFISIIMENVGGTAPPTGAYNLMAKIMEDWYNTKTTIVKNNFATQLLDKLADLNTVILTNLINKGTNGTGIGYLIVHGHKNCIAINKFLQNAYKCIGVAGALTKLENEKLMFFKNVFTILVQNESGSNNKQGVSSTQAYEIIKNMTTNLYLNPAGAAGAALAANAPVAANFVAAAAANANNINAIKNFAISDGTLGEYIGALMLRSDEELRTTTKAIDNTKLSFLVKFINGICSDELTQAANSLELARYSFINGIFTKLADDNTERDYAKQFLDLIILQAHGFADLNIDKLSNSTDVLGKNIGTFICTATINSTSAIGGTSHGNIIKEAVPASLKFINVVCHNDYNPGRLNFVNGIFESLNGNLKISDDDDKKLFYNEIIIKMNDITIINGANILHFGTADDNLGKQIGDIVMKGNINALSANALVSIVNQICAADLNNNGPVVNPIMDAKRAFITAIFNKITSAMLNPQLTPALLSTFAAAIIAAMSAATFRNVAHFALSDKYLGAEVGKLMCKINIPVAPSAPYAINVNANNIVKFIDNTCRINIDTIDTTRNDTRDFITAMMKAISETKDVNFAHHFIAALSSIGAANNITQLNFRHLTKINTGNKIGLYVGKMIVTASIEKIYNSLYFLRQLGVNTDVANSNNQVNFAEGVVSSITHFINFTGTDPEKKTAKIAFAAKILNPGPVPVNANNLTVPGAPGVLPDVGNSSLINIHFSSKVFGPSFLADIINATAKNAAEIGLFKYTAIAAVARSHDGSIRGGGGGGAGANADGNILLTHIANQAALITARTAIGAGAAVATSPDASLVIANSASGIVAAAEAVYISTYAMSAVVENIPAGTAHIAGVAPTPAEMNALFAKQGLPQAQAQPSTAAANWAADAAQSIERRSLLLNLNLPSHAQTIIACDAAVCAPVNANPTTIAAPPPAPPAVGVGINNTIHEADDKTFAQMIPVINKIPTIIEKAAAAGAGAAVAAEANNFMKFSYGAALAINIARANGIICNNTYNSDNDNAAAYTAFNVMTNPATSFTAATGLTADAVAADANDANNAKDLLILVNALCYYIGGIQQPNDKYPADLKALYEALFSNAAAPIAMVAMGAAASPAIVAGAAATLAAADTALEKVRAFITTLAAVDVASKIIADNIINCLTGKTIPIGNTSENVYNFLEDGTNDGYLNVGTNKYGYGYVDMGGGKRIYRAIKLKKSKTNYKKSKIYHSRNNKLKNKQYTKKNKFNASNRKTKARK